MNLFRSARAVFAAACIAAAAVPGVPASATSPATAVSYSADLLHDARLAAAEMGLPVETVAAQLHLQDAVGLVDQAAQARWPAEYAGLWIEPENGGRVVVAFTGGASSKVRALKRGFPRPDLLHARTFARSHRDLLAVQRRMIDDREAVKSGTLSFPGVTGGYDLDVDVRRNAVVASVPGATEATRAAFRARYGDVVVQDGPVTASASCGRLTCKHTMRSGLGITNGSLICSTAFAGFNNRLFTAGHCGVMTSHDNGTFGSQVATQQSGDVDAQIIGLSSGWYAGAWIWVNSSTQTRPVTSTSLYTAFAVGATICKSGRITNDTCGSVTSKTFSPNNVPGSYNFIKSTMCVQKGDSGAGVYSTNQAVGIVSGVATDSSGTQLPCSDPNFFSSSGHIQFAANTFTTTVKTSEGKPVFSSLTGATRLGTTVTANFDKPVLCSNVAASKWRATNVTSVTVTNAACAPVTGQESNYKVVLTLGRQLQPGTAVSVSLVTGETDVANNIATVPQTQSTTVPL